MSIRVDGRSENNGSPASYPNWDLSLHFQPISSRLDADRIKICFRLLRSYIYIFEVDRSRVAALFSRPRGRLAERTDSTLARPNNRPRDRHVGARGDSSSSYGPEDRQG
jgi:hypothetical protein